MNSKKSVLAIAIISLTSLYLLGMNSQNSGHIQWVEESLKTMQSIKPAMTRSDLQKVFTTEGGISTRIHRVYVYRQCPYFKVDVEFQPDQSSPTEESPNDQIARISKPYLAWSTTD